MPALIRGMLSCCLFLLITGVGFAQEGTGRDSAHGGTLLEPGRDIRTDTFVFHFDFNSSVVRRTDSLPVHRLRPYASYTFHIIGYTDTVGSLHYNHRLSLRRAQAVQTAIGEELSKYQSVTPNVPFVEVTSNVFSLDARGEADPLPGDNSLSRRVVITVKFDQEDTTDGRWHTTIFRKTDLSAAEELPAAPVARPDSMKAAAPDTSLTLVDINFIDNTATLSEAARFILPIYLDYLMTLKSRYLEIDGYCNAPPPLLPSSDPLFKLSVQRAKFIYECLKEKGFDPTHLSYKGFGNANPRHEHPYTAEQMRENMRVEVRVFRAPPQ
ncbi:MAG TPA: OmpA family protein [Puia sp.]|nr:OmpA family protein [Puia sp.]